jgi:hypothetical protein
MPPQKDPSACACKVVVRSRSRARWRRRSWCRGSTLADNAAAPRRAGGAIRIDPAAGFEFAPEAHPGKPRAGKVRRVRRDLPAAIALSDLLLAQALRFLQVEDEKRRVDKQHRGVGRVCVSPHDCLLDAGGPAGGHDRAIRLGSDDACLVCDSRVPPSEVHAENSQSAPPMSLPFNKIRTARPQT